MNLTNVLTGMIKDWIQDLLENFVNQILNSFYYRTFMVENELGNLSISFDKIYIYLYGWATFILTLLFIKKIISCYFAWQSGDPDTSPLVVVVNYCKSLIAMIIFGQVYKLVIPIGYQIYEGIFSLLGIQIAGDWSNELIGVVSNTRIGFVTLVAALVLLCCWIAFYFQTLMRGIEVLLMRLVMPFASIGLLSSDGGAFNIMVKKFMQNIATIIMQRSINKTCSCSCYELARF